MPIATLYAARNIDFAPTLVFDYEGAELPLIGATISMQVREYPGASGAPLAEDSNVEFTDEAHPTLVGWRQLITFSNFSKEILAGMPGQNQPTPGDAQTFVHEIKITYADGTQDSLLTGEFILSAGVDAT